MWYFALVSLALAQTPGGMLLPGGPTAPQAGNATSRWTVAETPSLRFPDAQTPGPTFEAGLLVVVLVTEGSRARIQKGDLVGWVPVSALTDQPPAPAPLPALELPKIE